MIDLELKRIAQEINVIKDPAETDYAWKRRVIYSICGRQALASLWDGTEDDTVSVQHVKQRISDILIAYQRLFPEIAGEDNYGDNIGTLTELVYGSLLNSGQMYHKSNRVTSPFFSSYSMGNVSLVKGIYATTPCNMSGIGPYFLDKKEIIEEKSNQYFLPDSTNIIKGLIKNAVWHDFINNISDYEFLKQKPPFNQGYWTNTPDDPSELNLMRSKVDVGVKQYYLFKEENGARRVSDLPEWINHNRRHVDIAVFMLREKSVLPPVVMEKRTTIAEIRIGYRLPQPKETIINTYSWPVMFNGEDRPFRRIIALPLYNIMKNIFIQSGYNVEER